MNSLIHLNKVVKRLKSHELIALNAFLHSFKVDTIYPDSKSASLIDLLSDEKQPKVPDVLQFKLYGKTNPKAFQKLVDRTRDKVYESLLFDNNLNKINVHPSRNRVGYILRKKLIEAEILSTRGLVEDVEFMYDKMLHKAKQYEFYDIALEILYTKHTFTAFRYGASRLNKIKADILIYEGYRKLINNSRLIFDDFVARINYAASSEAYFDELPKLIRELQQSFDKTQSPMIGYFLFFIETELFQQRNELKRAKDILEKMVSLLLNNVSVHTRNRLGTAYGNLANNELLMFQFDSGLEYIKQSIKYFKESPVNLNVIKEVEFLLQLFQNNFTEAEAIAIALYESSSKQKTSFLFYKRTFLFACLKNLQGDYKRSEELLNEVREIEKDKEGWNIGIRLLQIMNLVDRGKTELLESNVMNLKKYLLRLKGQQQARKRYAVILRILTRFMNDNYQFRKTYKRSQKYFDLLASDDARYSWSVKGHEVIAFHEWFISRMEFRKYSYKNLFETKG